MNLYLGDNVCICDDPIYETMHVSEDDFPKHRLHAELLEVTR